MKWVRGFILCARKIRGSRRRRGSVRALQSAGDRASRAGGDQFAIVPHRNHDRMFRAALGALETDLMFL